MNLELNRGELWILSEAVRNYREIISMDYQQLMKNLDKSDFNLMYGGQYSSEMRRVNDICDKISFAHKETADIEKYLELREKFEGGVKK
jgi:conjugal transfer/entry exclusion protein